jgi:hypothetical protein
VEIRDQVECYGKSSAKMPTRPETMRWLDDAGMPVMRWSLASDYQALDDLFETWQTDAILIKRSGSWGGTSVTMFSRERAREIEWDPQTDLFCPEVNTDDGDVYKLEMFGPDLLLGWVSRAPSARARMSEGKLVGIYGAYGHRELYEWTEQILQPATEFGKVICARGFGHISLDLMRNPSGQFEVIEVNLGNAAIWWTSQFEIFRERYARAIYRLLVDQHGAPTTVASKSVRLKYKLIACFAIPKLLVREAQGAWTRNRISRELESQYATPERSKHD